MLSVIRLRPGSLKWLQCRCASRKSAEELDGLKRTSTFQATDTKIDQVNEREHDVPTTNKLDGGKSADESYAVTPQQSGTAVSEIWHDGRTDDVSSLFSARKVGSTSVGGRDVVWRPAVSLTARKTSVTDSWGERLDSSQILRHNRKTGHHRSKDALEEWIHKSGAGSSQNYPSATPSSHDPDAGRYNRYQPNIQEKARAKEYDDLDQPNISWSAKNRRRISNKYWKNSHQNRDHFSSSYDYQFHGGREAGTPTNESHLKGYRHQDRGVASGRYQSQLSDGDYTGGPAQLTTEVSSRSGADVLAGVHSVMMAVTSGLRHVHCVYYRPPASDRVAALLEECSRRHVPLEPVSPAHLSILTRGIKSHQNVCARVGVRVVEDYNSLLRLISEMKPISDSAAGDGQHTTASSLDSPQQTDYSSVSTNQQVDLSGRGEPRVWVLLDRIHDPMNMGSIIRSCCFLGAERLIVTASGSCRLSGVVSRASAGAAETFPIHSVSTANYNQLLSLLASCNWQLLAADSQQSAAAADWTPPLHYTQLEPGRNTVLVVGNEGSGVDPALLRLCQRVTISAGKALPDGLDSLNVGVATALLLSRLINFPPA